MNRPVNRSLLHAFGKHARWSEKTAQDAFHESGIYAGRAQWLTWATRFFAGTGVAFLLAGILFFFAWNWADMSRMLKFGIIGGGIVVITIVSMILRKKHEFAFQLGLTIVSALVGVLFAVHGQEYQTGANSFELFRNWAVAIALLVVISNFPPLWMLYLVLLNIVVITWNIQFEGWQEGMLFTELFIMNTFGLIAWELCRGFGVPFAQRRWFLRVAGFAAFVFLSWKVFITGHHFSGMSRDALVCCVVIIPAFVFGAGYLGFFRKDIFFLALICFCTVMIASNFLDLLLPPVKESRGEGLEAMSASVKSTLDRMYLIMMMRGLFIIGLTSLIGVQLVKLSKKWRNHEQS
ncbi:MAG: hypothetical protein FD123_2126 [Bacteroidetes bacterium]|nr:MAG: hypothetical protein FD123_2126 [Bacteroidota bacterium]